METYRLIESVTEVWMEYESEVGGAMDVFDETTEETIWEGKLRDVPDKEFFQFWGIKFNPKYDYRLEKGDEWDQLFIEIPLT
jgi:hypothetical protein